MQPGLLWVLEQIPGYVHAEDQTKFLTKMGYWPSYNAPFYEDIANRCACRSPKTTLNSIFLRFLYAVSDHFRNVPNP